MRRQAILLLTVITAAFVMVASPALATTFTVNSTADPGTDGCDATECTLREAIQEADAPTSPGADTINFAIPGNGPHTITPSSELPMITQQVTIDGYTEQLDETPGASVNTSTDSSTNAELRIVLSGASAQEFQTGLRINAPNVVVRGLVINNWKHRGIGVFGGGLGTSIEGNFIGTDADGTSGQGNRIEGVLVAGASGVSVGGTTPDKRNLISGNSGEGLLITGATNNQVEGNLIGTNASGTNTPNNLGNGGGGVRISATSSGNTVGGVDDLGTSESPANTIAFNDFDGVAVVDASSTGNRILSNSIFSNGDNSIFSNGDLGIDLGSDGVTPNDGKDRDTGANKLQNFPVITSATTVSGTTTIKGKLNSRPRKAFTIQFFSNTEADASGNGEGQTLLDEIKVKTNRKGKRSFTLSAVLPAGENVVTATATNNSTGDTSEFSKAVTTS